MRPISPTFPLPPSVDVWDVEGAMMVFHGHTKVTPVDVQSCLNVIKAKAFDKSPYPLFLLIELHVRNAMQVSLAEQIKTTLGGCW